MYFGFVIVMISPAKTVEEMPYQNRCNYLGGDSCKVVLKLPLKTAVNGSRRI